MAFTFCPEVGAADPDERASVSERFCLDAASSARKYVSTWESLGSEVACSAVAGPDAPVFAFGADTGLPRIGGVGDAVGSADLFRIDGFGDGVGSADLFGIDGVGDPAGSASPFCV